MQDEIVMSLFTTKLSEYSKEVKSRYIIPFTWLLVALAFSNSFIYFHTYKASSLAAACFITGMLALIIPFIKYKVKSHLFIANYLVFVFFLCISFLAIFSGGVMSNAIWWLGAIPLLASFLLNACFGLIWFVLVLCNFLSMLYLGHHQLLPNNILAGTSSEGRLIISFIMNTILLSILCILADLIRDKAFIEKEDLSLKSFQLNQVASLGKLASGVAHEINNPLTVIKGSQLRIARLIEESDVIDKVTLIKYMNKINKNISRIQSVTALMRTISSHDYDRAISTLSIQDILNDVLKMLSEDIEIANIEIEKDFPDERIKFKGIYAEIFQAFFNVFENAIQELSPLNDLRKVKILLSKTEKDIVVLIEDNGSGIPKGIRDNIFDPFFTTKSIGAGRGLGLSFSLNAFVSSGGNLKLLEETPHTVFQVTLPFI
jgi:two-component system NtrC family sensor kinase